MDRATVLPRSPLKIILSLLALLIAAPLAYGLWQSLPGFGQLFGGFANDIPWLSHWVVDHPQQIWLFLRVALVANLIGLCIWLFIRARWAAILLSFATAFTWLALLGLLVVLYLPVFTIAV